MFFIPGRGFLLPGNSREGIMDFTNVNTTPSFVNAPVVTTVEKNDRQAPQVKPIDSSAESTRASLGDKELHSKKDGAKKSDDPMSPEAMAKVAKDIQDKLDQMGSSLGFAIDKKYDALVAEISNRDTGEVIRQIPSDEVLALREKLKEVVGMFFDEKM